VLCRRTKESLQTTSEIRGLADVRLGLRIVSAKQENSRCWWQSREEFGVTGRDELEAIRKHELIVEGIYD